MSQPQRIHAMSLTREHTATVVIDVQERLFPAMDTDHREEVIRNIKVLATSARRLRLPMFITEHCPKELVRRSKKWSTRSAPASSRSRRLLSLAAGLARFARGSKPRGRATSS